MKRTHLLAALFSASTIVGLGSVAAHANDSIEKLAGSYRCEDKEGQTFSVAVEVKKEDEIDSI